MTLLAARACFALHLATLPAYCLARVWQNAPWLFALTYAVPVTLVLGSVLHAAHTTGAWRSLALLASAATIAWLVEATGVATGLPFGHYEYTGTLGLTLPGSVPALIPLAWMMIAYPSWHAARLLAATTPARIAIGAWAVMAYDLSLDPRMVADGHWRWLDGGAYFGIPVSNFIGWFLTAAAIFAVWHWVEPRSAVQMPDEETGVRVSRNRVAKNLPAWAFIVLWLGETAAQALFWNGPLVGLIVFAAMGVVGAPVLSKLLKTINGQHK